MTKAQENWRVVAIVLVSVLCIAPMQVHAQVKFRKPLDTNPSPVINYYFDHNVSVGATQVYWCPTTPSAKVYDQHKGTDFNAPTFTNVYAAAQGTPYYRFGSCATSGSQGCGGGFGNHIRMDHAGNETDGLGMVSIYAHFSQNSPIAASVSPTTCGTYIGQSGSSGSSTNPHLHFELRPSGFSGSERLDPFGKQCTPITASSWYAMSADVPTTQCPPPTPPPSNVAVNNPTATSLQLNFFDNATNDTATIVERKTGTGGTWAQITSFVALSGTQSWYWVNSGLASSQTYCYRLRSQTPTGNSLYSSEACGTTRAAGATAPLAPSNVFLDGVTASSIRVNFKDNATNETNIIIERKIGSGSWISLGGFGVLSGAGYWNWTNTGLTTKTSYCYRLKAVNGVLSSGYSNAPCVTTP